MKPEKMSHLEVVVALSPLETRVRDGVLAHIAALEAERDEAQSLKATDARDHAEEVRALRERVTALEEDVADKRALAHKWKTSATGLHATLAAIRQRAGDREALTDVATRVYSGCGVGAAVMAEVSGAVARYIVGEDGAVDGVWEGPEHPQKEDARADVPDTGPTTAEAFATVRAVLQPLKATGPYVRHPDALLALSLLERRMRAMARELGLVASDLYHERFATAESRVKDLIALTDAPPGFTLEEIAREIDALGIIIPEDERQALLERLAALRR